MEELYYIGLDIHKKTISYCTKTKDGTIIARGKIDATRPALTAWARAIQRLGWARWKQRSLRVGSTIISSRTLSSCRWRIRRC